MDLTPPMSSAPVPENIDDRVEQIVRNLKSMGINLLAIDFDHTLIDVHTGGRYNGPPAELSNRVRTFFRKLIPRAMDQGIFVAIVTFSGQIPLIRNVLLDHFPDHAAKIPIRGNVKDTTPYFWRYDGKGSKEGKQAHIASAVADLESTHQVNIKKCTTVLLDDDASNIEFALNDGTYAVHLDVNRPDMMIDILARWTSPALTTTSSSRST
eukprot:gene2622-5131_t